MRHLILASLTLVFTSVSLCHAADDTPTAPLELVVLGDSTISRVDVRVDVENVPITKVWDQTFASLFAFFDKNGNGLIDDKEAAVLPSPLSLRQSMGSGFTPPVGQAPRYAELDKSGDGKVKAEDLAAYYRGKGVGNLVVGVGRLPGGSDLTASLLKALDSDGDGKVSEKDWNAATGALGRFDANDDELIGAGELVSKLLYPGAAGTFLLKPSAAGATPPGVLGDLPLLLLPANHSDTQWADEVARRKPGMKLGAPSEWRAHQADGRWAVHLGGKTSDAEIFAYASDGVRLCGWVASGRLGDSVLSSRRTMTTQFESPTTEPEVAGTTRRRGGGNLSWLTPIADRDGDGKLDRKELDSWFELQSQIARGQVLMTVLDGGGLFEVLDTSRDGALSIRELRKSWDRLKEAGCVADGVFDRSRIPRVVLAAVSCGYPQSLSPEQRRGPAWSKAMDRNGDGDVSRREFTGTADKFEKLDKDKDGLIDPDEAAQATTNG